MGILDNLLRPPATPRPPHAQIKAARRADRATSAAAKKAEIAARRNLAAVDGIAANPPSTVNADQFFGNT